MKRYAAAPEAPYDFTSIQVVKGTFTPELSNILGTQRKRGDFQLPPLSKRQPRN
jgi:hypothetical protein